MPRVAEPARVRYRGPIRRVPVATRFSRRKIARALTSASMATMKSTGTSPESGAATSNKMQISTITTQTRIAVPVASELV